MVWEAIDFVPFYPLKIRDDNLALVRSRWIHDLGRGLNGLNNFNITGATAEVSR
jgi:hypothetical protein